MVCNVRQLIDEAVVERPRLENAPLRAVICQVRFPRRLALGEEEVGPIQRAVGKRYPLLLQEQAIELSTVEPGTSPRAFFAPTGSQQRIFRFQDLEQRWTATVGSEAISLETTDYMGMKDMLVRWSELIEAAAAALGITAQTRVGLRYINELPCPGPRREDLSGWVREELVTLIGAHRRTEDTLRLVSHAQFRQPEGALCNLRHGIAPDEGEEGRFVFLLDLDCFRQQQEALDLGGQIRLLAALNQAANDLFDWSFPARTRAGFGPELPPPGGE